MKNSAYWQKRFEEIENALNQYGQDTFAAIRPTFDKATRDINAEIEKWIYRISVNNEISMADARKLLNADELAEFKWSVEEYIKYGQKNAINQQWMKQLENASAKYHISRLEALKLHAQQGEEVAFGNYLDQVDGMARKVYSEGYYRSIFEVQKGFGVGWNIASIDDNKLSKLITKPWAADGKNFSDRIWTAKTQMVNGLHSELTRACILGKAPDEATKNLSQYVNKKFKNSKVQAGRLVMTEQAFFSAAAQKDAFNELGVEEYEIVATLDSHTSVTCQDLDGKHFPMKNYEPGVTAPPFHVWCRSTTCPYFDDEFSIGGRAARDADGKTYYVPSDMKYPQWKKEHIKDATPKPGGSLTQLAADKEQYQKYKTIFGEEFPKTFEKYRDLKYNDIKEWERFKSSKQEVLNQMNFEDMTPLIHKLGDREVRMWYKLQDEKIPSLIDKHLTIEEQARQACALRNLNRTNARDLMKDQKRRAELDITDPNSTFEQLIEKKMKHKELSYEEAIRDILKTASKTNAKVNEILGVK